MMRLKQSNRTKSVILSVFIFVCFVGAWQSYVNSLGGTAEAMDPEYAALLGGQAKGESAIPGPGDVGAELWMHFTDPFYDAGPNDKGVGIQLA